MAIFVVFDAVGKVLESCSVSVWPTASPFYLFYSFIVLLNSLKMHWAIGQLKMKVIYSSVLLLPLN